MSRSGWSSDTDGDVDRLARDRPDVGHQAVAADQPVNELWLRVLNGSDPGLPRLRWLWGHVPSSPRCKLCAAPFAGPGRLLTRVVMHGASSVNPLLRSACFGQIRKMPGGAEIELTVLFADIRGSTGIAERATAGEFRALLQQFYRRASTAIDDHDGVVDKFLGDGIMALFIPLIAGEMHAERAIAGGRALLRAVESGDLFAGGVRVGVGVHTGPAFVGAIGTNDRLDFTALGDTVNVAVRLGALAGPGELVVSDAAWRAAGGDAAVERQKLPIAGRSEPLDVVVVRPESPVAVA